jgi:VWFA-related protein
VLLTSIDNSNSGLRMEGRTSGFYGAADRMEWSLGQLSQLAAYENTQPGLKLVFFISPGWPMFPMATQDTTTKDRQWTFNSVVALTNGLREAHVILYALDPFELGGRNPFLFQAYLKGVTKPNDAQYPDLSLGVLSTHSGGTFQTTQMDVKGEIEKAVRDANTYYTISFESQPGDGVDQYHALKLDVDKPGVTARTTTGYYSNVPR